MKKILLTFLIVSYQLSIFNLAQAQQVPIVLTQQLFQAPQSILVSHRHEVTLVLDTQNFVAVHTVGNFAEADSLRFPDGQLRMNGNQLIIDSAFPYHSGIEVHTAALMVEAEARYFSRLTIHTHDGRPARMESFDVQAYTHSLVFVDVPVICKNSVSLGAHREGAVVYYDSVNAPKQEWELNDGGLLVKRMPDGGSETHRMMRFLPFGYLDLFAADGHNHRECPIFMTFSYGLSGASQHPFGGLTGWMGNFSMSTGYHFNYSFHYAFALGQHWSLGVGFGTGADIFRTDNCLLGVTPGATGQPDHLGPVAEPTTLDAGQRTWNSKFGTAFIYLPLRVEWRQRDDWRGLRLAAELHPGINYSRSNTILYNNGIHTDGSRTDLLTNKGLGDYLTTWRCDLRLEAAWNHLGLFFQTSLLPLFRTNGENAFDTHMYPMSIGINFTI